MAARRPIIGVIIQDDAIRVRFAKWKGQIPDRLQTAIIKTTKKIEATAKKSIVGGKKTGREYRRGSVVHKASAAGEAPASNTGALLSSIVSNIGEVGSTVKHGLYLELGTKRMDERPFLRPAVDKHGPGIEAAVVRELNR